jgi:hypothetical protein
VSCVTPLSTVYTDSGSVSSRPESIFRAVRIAHKCRESMAAGSNNGFRCVQTLPLVEPY